MKHLLLIDANSLIHRAYHAFPRDLQNVKGELTGATFGFTKSLLKAIKDLKPTHLAAAFDLGEPTFRHLKYDGYKAHREKMPDDLFQQLARIKEILNSLNIPVFEKSSYEADDLVGTLASKAEKIKDVKITIITGDYDALQLVKDSIVEVWTPSRGAIEAKIYNKQAVVDKYGFPPNLVIDFKALRGDPSDAIPGVSGIGDKTAIKLIQNYGDLDRIYKKLESEKKLDSFSEKIQQKLITEKDQAYLSRELATIDINVPIEFDLDACQIDNYEVEKVAKIFNELGFDSLYSDLPKSKNVTSPSSLFADTTGLDISELDLNLEPILRKMEEKGVKINKDYLKGLEVSLEEERQKIKKKVYDFAGQEFNLDSPSQLSFILYDKLAIPKDNLRKGQAGHYPTDAASLKKLIHVTPLSALILNYRELSKLLTTYVRPLPKLVDKNSRIHTHYAPDTLSGRISSKEPNLQNIPVKNEIGREIRKAFLAEKGFLLISADYSQIELRVGAHLSDDQDLIETFKAGKDIHEATAQKLSIDRRMAKVINFSILYGKGAYGLAEDLAVDQKKAQEFIDLFFESYPKLKNYLELVIEKTRKDGYITTLFGKKRYFPNIHSPNFFLRSSAEREAVNHPIQGTAAEILKMAMVEMGQKKIDDKLILTVHDELVFEVPESEVVAIGKMIKDIMENVTKLKVPLIVNLKVGKNWQEMKEV